VYGECDGDIVIAISQHATECTVFRTVAVVVGSILQRPNE